MSSVTLPHIQSKIKNVKSPIQQVLHSVSSSKSVQAKREAVLYGIIIMQFIYGLVTALGAELARPSLCLD